MELPPSSAYNPQLSSRSTRIGKTDGPGFRISSKTRISSYLPLAAWAALCSSWTTPLFHKVLRAIYRVKVRKPPKDMISRRLGTVNSLSAQPQATRRFKLRIRLIAARLLDSTHSLSVQLRATHRFEVRKSIRAMAIRLL